MLYIRLLYKDCYYHDWFLERLNVYWCVTELFSQFHCVAVPYDVYAEKTKITAQLYSSKSGHRVQLKGVYLCIHVEPSCAQPDYIKSFQIKSTYFLFANFLIFRDFPPIR